MADIATIFHWSPESMNPMLISELMEWRELARVRSNTDEE